MNKILTNWIGLVGAYGIPLADFTGAVHGLPNWVSIPSAMAGVALTLAIAYLRYQEGQIKRAEARIKQAEAYAKELDNKLTAKKFEDHENEDRRAT